MQPTTNSPPEQPPAPEAPDDSSYAESRDGEDGGGNESGGGGIAWYADSLFWSLFLAALAADQITKAIVTSNLSRGESWPDDGFVRATYARNTGTAFGLFRDQGFTLTIISLVAVAGMIYFFRGTALKSWPMRLSIAIMLGGAIGNLTDRIRLGFVVDFIDIGAWPIFNLADSFITTGIAILVVSTVIFPDRISPASAGPQNDPMNGETPEPDDAVAAPEDDPEDDQGNES
ncbi:MAG: signal peptidase II [Chloroflexi bacterium]|nr:signal peptidase II [Chloroflexota bacterium]